MVPIKSKIPIRPAADKPSIGDAVSTSLARVSPPSKNNSRKFNVPVEAYKYAIPISINTSPILVVMKALIMAARAEGFAYQNPISRYEHKP
jgi:hypothetical protein